MNKSPQNDPKLTKKIIETASIIDVRTEEEIQETGMFKNAIHIPLDDIENKLDKIQKLPQPLILYCRSGNRSHHAIVYLKSVGLTALYNGINLETMTTLIEAQP